MKIALMAFRFGPSHGSILQTYALTKILESLGHQVTIIDRQRPVTIKNYYTMVKRVILALKKHNIERGDFRLGEFSHQLMMPFNKFIEKYLRKQTITISKKKDLNEIGNDRDYEGYVVGSDQTWRPKYVYNIYDYFLEFVPKERKVKRVSYATSFGTSDWEYNEEQTRCCKELLQRFDGVSVREFEGVKLCNKYFEKEAIHVLDPTLLLTGNDYRKLFNGKKLKEGEQFVGYNFLDHSDAKMRLVKDVCVILRTNKHPINVNIEDSRKKYITMPSIEDWLQNIDSSVFTIVDSFHATVFSILFHKNFITIANVNRGLSRFTSLLSALGLDNRLITEEETITEELVKSKIDWTDVDERLNKLRIESISFINKYLIVS